MSTILDALKKVERERESPGDRLRHEPEHTPKRARRVSTITIVVCAILGFGAGAGIALWRSSAPVGDETPAVASAPPADAEVAMVAADPVPRSGPAVRSKPAGRLDGNTRPAPPTAASAGAPGAVADSALEPSPFEPPPAEVAAVAAVPAARAEAPAGKVPATAAPDAVAALPRPAPRPLKIAPDADDANEPAGEELPLDDESEIDHESEDADPPAEATLIDTGRSPPGAPRVTLSFLQWSADPARRFAFISVDGGPSQRVREGDAAGAVSVAGITPDGVRLRHADTLFIIRPRH
jgi:hypothetical protein